MGAASAQEESECEDDEDGPGDRGEDAGGIELWQAEPAVEKIGDVRGEAAGPGLACRSPAQRSTAATRHLRLLAFAALRAAILAAAPAGALLGTTRTRLWLRAPVARSRLSPEGSGHGQCTENSQQPTTNHFFSPVQCECLRNSAALMPRAALHA